VIRYHWFEGGVDARWRGSVSSLFSYVDLEARIPTGHPLRVVLAIVDEALARLTDDFDAI
jgi:hypothetical protein